MLLIARKGTGSGIVAIKVNELQSNIKMSKRNNHRKSITQYVKFCEAHASFYLKGKFLK